MPTNDERREVAARLRRMADDYKRTPALNVIACGELPAPIDDALTACGLGGAVSAAGVCARLADLVEPVPKRTCRNVGGGDYFHCSECQYGCDYIEPDYVAPDYCPWCGAKVVGE